MSDFGARPEKRQAAILLPQSRTAAAFQMRSRLHPTNVRCLDVQALQRFRREITASTQEQAKVSISAIRMSRSLAFAITIAAVVLASAMSPANAQFVCGGSGTGAEPQNGGSSSGSAGSVACGLGVSASGSFSIAVGTVQPGGGGVQASGAGAIAIGTGAIFGVTAQGANSIAIGTDTFTDSGSTGQIAIGRSSSAQGAKAIAIGDGAFINPGYSNSTAIGGAVGLNGSNTTLIGANSNTANIAANNSVGLGADIVLSGSNATAVGQGSTATALGATALGQGSSATFSNSTAVGSGVTTVRANQVAVGTAANTYTLAGITSAASLAAQSGPVNLVTADAAGNLATLNASSIASVTALSALDGRVSNLETNVRSLNADMRKAFEGSAVAIAMGGAALPDNKKFAISANWGNFSGENALGGMAQIRLSNNFVANAAVGAGFARGGVGGRVGGTFAW